MVTTLRKISALSFSMSVWTIVSIGDNRKQKDENAQTLSTHYLETNFFLHIS